MNQELPKNLRGIVVRALNFFFASIVILSTCSKPEADEAPAIPQPQDVKLKTDTIGDITVNLIAPEKIKTSGPTIAYSEVKPLLDSNCIDCHKGKTDLSVHPATYDKAKFKDSNTFYSTANFRMTVDPKDKQAMPPESEMDPGERAKLAMWFAQFIVAEPIFARVKKVEVTVAGKKLSNKEYQFSLNEDKSKLITVFKLIAFDSKTSADGKIDFFEANHSLIETRNFKISPNGNLTDLTITTF